MPFSCGVLRVVRVVWVGPRHGRQVGGSATMSGVQALIGMSNEARCSGEEEGFGEAAGRLGLRLLDGGTSLYVGGGGGTLYGLRRLMGSRARLVKEKLRTSGLHSPKFPIADCLLHTSYTPAIPAAGAPSQPPALLDRLDLEHALGELGQAAAAASLVGGAIGGRLTAWRRW